MGSFIAGISLTVAGVDDRRFDVQVIPYTWEHTNLRFVRVNDLMNLRERRSFIEPSHRVGRSPRCRG